MLVFAAVLAPAGAAQADKAYVNDFPNNSFVWDRVDVMGTPGQVIEVPAAQFNVDYSGDKHLIPGGKVRVTPTAPGSPNVTADPQEFAVPGTWAPGSRLSFRPKLKVTMPSTGGRSTQFVTFNVAPTGDCTTGFDACITGTPVTVRVTMEVKPHPLTGLKVTGDSNGITVTWDTPPHQSALTGYHVDRSDMSTRDTDIFHGPEDGLGGNVTSFHDAQAVPGRQYCYGIYAYWEVGGNFNGGDYRNVCGRINRAPSTPGAASPNPTLHRYGSTISWGPSTDPDGDGVMYELQHKNSAPGAQWTEYWKGFSSNSLGVIEQGGTWQYRVRAFDNDGASSGWSEVSPAFVADSTGPRQPQLRYDQPRSDNGWYKGPVKVTFYGAEDSPLPDGSAGGGVADPEGYPAPATLDTHGADQLLRPQAIDRVGNEGAVVTHHVNVDMKAPVIAFDECPTEVMQDSALTLRYTASDEGSGLDGDATGTVTAVTSTLGSRTETITVSDRVGHQTSAKCTFNVYKNSPPPAVQDLRSSDANSGDGDFTISWAASTDPDGDPVDYTVEEVGSATPLAQRHAGTTFDLTNVSEGTHTYRITAVDNPRRLHEGASEVTVKVDKTAPGAPKSRTDRAADYGDWFKDRVEVTFYESDDPLLADGTLGSGVADDGYSAPEVLIASGTARGNATDRAGNPSAGATHPVKVDATSPRLVPGCPTKPVLEGTPVTVTWDASDEESGLRTAAHGEIPVDTTAPGRKTVPIPVAVDNLGHETRRDPCTVDVYANTAPDAPAGLNKPDSPRANGEFDLTWDKAHDPDLVAGDSITYTFQQRDNDDADWTTVDDLTALSRHVDLDGGTWQFRVRTEDKFGATSPWADFALVKVDDRAPTQPTLSTTPATATNGWFKDSVTVSFSGSADPKLGDGSDGVGDIRYTADQTISTTGTHEVPGSATDGVNNVSAPLDPVPVVKVDADAPTVQVDCPTGTLTVGQPATATWTAQDVGSGLETADSGTIALDTSAPGTHTRSEQQPIRDRAGHEIPAASCTYTVAYKFAGFLAPVNGSAVNVGKTGRTYPIKWRLQRHDGSLISDAEAQALVPAMSAGDKLSGCDFGLAETDTLEEATTGATELRYDAAADQFIYNYKSPAIANCYVLGIRKADGLNTKQVNFNFTR